MAITGAKPRGRVMSRSERTRPSQNYVSYEETESQVIRYLPSQVCVHKVTT